MAVWCVFDIGTLPIISSFYASLFTPILSGRISASLNDKYMYGIKQWWKQGVIGGKKSTAAAPTVEGQETLTHHTELEQAFDL